MRVGANWPYDALPQAPERTRQLFRAMNPDSVVIMSHTAEADYRWLLEEFPALEFTVRAKLGPAHQVYPPGDILNYREWPSERSLGDSLELLASAGKALRAVKLNEFDIEGAREPVDDATNRQDAIDAYIDWWWQEAPRIRLAFPSVQLAVSPLSQGNPVRFGIWAMALDPLYEDADWISEHCYFPAGSDPADWGYRYRYFKAKYPGKPVHINETDDNNDRT